MEMINWLCKKIILCVIISICVICGAFYNVLPVGAPSIIIGFMIFAALTLYT